MSRHSRRSIPIALGLIALIAGVGCSSVPTEPRPEAGSPPTPAHGAAPGTVVVKASTPSVQPATSSRTISGTVGGVLSAGSFTLVIPPLAVPGNATVTITQPDPTKPYVDLEISPSSANRFLVPVTLIADAGPMSTKKLAAAYISWLNPSTGKWEPMPSQVDLEHRVVSCPLSHFSTYSVEFGGKAGW